MKNFLISFIVIQLIYNIDKHLHFSCISDFGYLDNYFSSYKPYSKCFALPCCIIHHVKGNHSSLNLVKRMLCTVYRLLILPLLYILQVKVSNLIYCSQYHISFSVLYQVYLHSHESVS